MKKYNLEISSKTKILNFFRLLFKLKIVEFFLISTIRKCLPNSLYNKLVPPNYLYPFSSTRFAKRNKINYELDLSDVVDHGVYFMLADPGRDKLYSLIKKEMTVIDIGANMGDTALNFSKIVTKAGSVIAFEPDERNFNRAHKNISINSAENILLKNIGLGSQNKTEKLSRVNSGNQGMNRILKNQNEFEFTEVVIQKLDDFIIANSITKVDLIKIDVEGFEMNVLNGASQTIKQFKPILFIEINDTNLIEHNASASQLFNYLTELNYSVYHSQTNKKLTHQGNYANCHFDIYATSNK